MYRNIKEGKIKREKKGTSKADAEERSRAESSRSASDETQIMILSSGK